MSVIAGPPQPLEKEVQPETGRHRKRDELVTGGEPKRDWSVGFITGHRTRVIVTMALLTMVLYEAQDVLWSGGYSQPHGWLQDSWSYGTLLWLAAIPAATLGLVGMLTFRYPDPKVLDAVEPITQTVALRIVSKGKNVAALRKTINRCLKEMGQRTRCSRSASKWWSTKSGSDRTCYR